MMIAASGGDYVTKDQAKTIRPKDQAKTIRLVMETYPRDHAMRIIDKILETFGVEYQEKGTNQQSPAFSYCNTGRSHSLTVLYIHKKGPWNQCLGYYTVNSWGNLVKHGSYK